MISITVNVTDGASPMLEEFISALTGKQAASLSKRGATSARNAAIKYHREFDKAGGWRGKRYLGTGSGDGSSFGAGVARGWAVESSGRTGAVIANDADYYRFKVTGGTITPKRAKSLTIPLVPEARGLRVATYIQNTGRKLFLSPSKKALMERAEGGGVRSVYALVSSVTSRPWPNAVPPDDVVGGAFAATYREALIGIIEKS